MYSQIYDLVRNHQSTLKSNFGLVLKVIILYNTNVLLFTTFFVIIFPMDIKSYQPNNNYSSKYLVCNILITIPSYFKYSPNNENVVLGPIHFLHIFYLHDMYLYRYTYIRYVL